MTDLELWKEIVRATHGISADARSVGNAVARVRALLAAPTPPAPAESLREEKRGRNRMETGGQDRSE